MSNILLWVGIALTVVGWLALGWQAAKRMAVKEELDRFPYKKAEMLHRRNYCWFTIIAGVLLIVIAIIV